MEQIIEKAGRTLELAVYPTEDDMSTHTVHLFLANNSGDRIGQIPAFDIDYPHDTDREIMEKVFSQACDKIRARIAAHPKLNNEQVVSIHDFAFPWKVYRRETDGTAYWIDDDGFLMAAPLLIHAGVDLESPGMVANHEDGHLTRNDLTEIYQALGFDLWRGILGGVPVQQSAEDFPQFSENPDIVGVLVYKQGATQIGMKENGACLLVTPTANHESDDLGAIEEDLAMLSVVENQLLPSGIELGEREEESHPLNSYMATITRTVVATEQVEVHGRTVEEADENARAMALSDEMKSSWDDAIREAARNIDSDDINVESIE